MSSRTLYEIITRQTGFAYATKVRSNRGEYTSDGVEKIVPLIIHYDWEGNFDIIELEDIFNGIVQHPYKPNSKQFNAERLADLEVSAFYKVLEHFPSLPLDSSGAEHALAEFLYSHIIYLKPKDEVTEKLKELSFIEEGKQLARIFEVVDQNFQKLFPAFFLDLFSVPKRKIGTFCYIGKKGEKLGIVPKTFGFNLTEAIPADRIARELSSLKNSERFLNPVPVEGFPQALAPYVTKLRIAIVGTETTILDGTDIYPSAVPKLACNLKREHKIYDISQVYVKDANIKFEVHRSGINAYHSVVQEFDERQITPGAIRLVFPGGVKVAGQVFEDQQATCSSGETIDVLMDFRTFVDKGAIAIFALMNGQSNLTLAEATAYFKSLPTQEVFVNGEVYEGYVGELPVFRPGQRYTDLCKPTKVSQDSISYALTGRKIVVSEHFEEEYSELRALAQLLEKVI